MLRIPLRPPPFVSNGLLLGLIFASVVSLGVPDLGAGTRAMLFGVLTLILMSVHYRLSRHQVPDIELLPNYVAIPRSLYAAEADELPYRDIISVNRIGRRGKRRLFIDSRERPYVLPETAFADPAGVDLLAAELERRLLAHPIPGEQRAKMGARARLIRTIVGRGQPATWTIAGILVALFVLQRQLGTADDPLGLVLVRLGANQPDFVSAGDWYRLISANWWHGPADIGWVHIGMNGLALISLGGFVERLIGSWRFVLVYCVSAIGGAAGSYFQGPGLYSVGASTAIFGLLGALAALHLRQGRTMPPELKQSVRWWAVILGINFLLPIFVPFIDGTAHLAGFATGLIVTGLLVRHPAFQALEHPAPGPQKIAAVAAALATVTGLGFAAERAVYWTRDDDLAVQRLLLTRDELAVPGVGVILNNYAFLVAVDPGADESALASADELATRAVELLSDEKDHSFVIDTLATVKWRRGSLDEAVDLERQAIEMTTRQRGIYVSQLARFLIGARRAPGGIVTRNDARPTDVVLHGVEITSAALRLDVELNRESRDGYRVYALARVDDALVGIVELLWTGNVPTGRSVRTVRTAGAQWQTPGLKMELAYIDAVGCAGCRRGIVHANAWPMDAEIAGYP